MPFCPKYSVAEHLRIRMMKATPPIYATNVRLSDDGDSLLFSACYGYRDLNVRLGVIFPEQMHEVTIGPGDCNAELDLREYAYCIHCNKESVGDDAFYRGDAWTCADCTRAIP